jgi:hypothetical protein
MSREDFLGTHPKKEGGTSTQTPLKGETLSAAQLFKNVEKKDDELIHAKMNVRALEKERRAAYRALIDNLICTLDE